MSNYIGVRCPVCNKKFTEADDIVVCPVCGAPHHRSCYAEKNQCAFQENHLSGIEWSDPAGKVTEDEGASSAGKTCARCGAENPRDSVFCGTCGYPMLLYGSQRSDEQPADKRTDGDDPGDNSPFPWVFPGGMGAQVNSITMAYGGLNPEDEIDGETVKEVAKYVGSGSAYYLPRFRLLSEYNRAFMPNFCAFLFSFFYYFYRKMYAIGALLLVVTVVSMIPGCLAWVELSAPEFIEYVKTSAPDIYASLGDPAVAEVNQAAVDHYVRLANAARTIRFVIVLIFALFANRSYYSKAIAAVHSIRSQRTETDADEAYYAALAKAGGTNKALVVVLSSLLGLLLFALVAFSNLLGFAAGL